MSRGKNLAIGYRGLSVMFTFLMTLFMWSWNLKSVDSVRPRWVWLFIDGTGRLMKDMTGECDVVAWVKVICLVLSALKLICYFVPKSEIMSKSLCNDLQAHRLLYNWTVHGKWRYCITALKSPPVHRIEFVF